MCYETILVYIVAYLDLIMGIAFNIRYYLLCGVARLLNMLPYLTIMDVALWHFFEALARTHTHTHTLGFPPHIIKYHIQP